MHTQSGVDTHSLPRRETINLEARVHIAQWLLWYRRRKEHEYPVDADFADHVGIKPSHLSSVLTFARSGGERGRSPGLDLLLQLSEVAHRSTDEIVRDPAPAQEGPAPPREHDSSPPAAPRVGRRTGGRKSGGGRS
jgi:hypothetical protein